MLPLAPAMFSTTTGWPSNAGSRADNCRATRSMPVPGVYGTTSVIGCSGHARAATALAAMRKAPRNRVSLRMMSPSCSWKSKVGRAVLERDGVVAGDALVVVRNGLQFVLRHEFFE